MILNGLLFTIGHKSFFKEQSKPALLSSFSHIKIKSIRSYRVKNSLSVDKRSILIDRHDVTFSPIRLTFRQELDWTVWLLRRARISCLEFYNCSVVNLVTVGYILVTPCRGGFRGFNGALLLCAPIWQWRLSGSLRCKHSCTYRMTLLIYKKVVSVLNRVDDTRQFFALPTLEVELEVLAELSNQR